MENDRTDKGKFLPGNKGKPKGALNKISRENKERVEWVLELLDESLEESIEKLKPKEKIDLWMNLQEYVRPKLQRTNVEIGAKEDNVVKFTFEVVPSGRTND